MNRKNEGRMDVHFQLFKIMTYSHRRKKCLKMGIYLRTDVHLSEQKHPYEVVLRGSLDQYEDSLCHCHVLPPGLSANFEG